MLPPNFAQEQADEVKSNLAKLESELGKNFIADDRTKQKIVLQANYLQYHESHGLFQLGKVRKEKEKKITKKELTERAKSMVESLPTEQWDLAFLKENLSLLTKKQQKMVIENEQA